MFALVDGNSFYASCQMAFDPSLQDRPVVVLSNNDGCIVAANAKAKSLNALLLKHHHGSFGRGGYRAAMPENMMFQPYFKVRELLEAHNAAVFSSNYELYGDMSGRMHRIIGRFGVEQEIYSIDESFLTLPKMSCIGLYELGKKIQTQVWRSIGIPVAVGIAPTKTLAKLANHLAKHRAAYQNVFVIDNPYEIELQRDLQSLPVGKVWGIGKRLAESLSAQGFDTVGKFQKAPAGEIRKCYGVVVERTLRELNAEVCFVLRESPADKKQIIASRSFGQFVNDLPTLERALLSHLTRALQKLRAQNSLCQTVTLFIRTNPFSAVEPFAKSHQTIVLPQPTDNDLFIAKFLRKALKSLWQPNYRYHKAGIVLGGILPKTEFQPDLFAQNEGLTENAKQQALVALMDQINLKEGKNTLFMAAAGSSRSNAWQMRRERMSPRYTTQWNELPIAYAKDVVFTKKVK